jgi:hypothetical protein
MNVASLELFKELYELSGWNLGERAWATWNDQDKVIDQEEGWDERFNWACPAYDLGYLLRQTNIGVRPHDDQGWKAFFHDKNFIAPIPEDAVCRLAIQLFKQGILQKEAA